AYVASPQAIAPAQLYRCGNSTYIALLQNNSKLTLALLAQLCIRLRQRIDEIERLSLKNATPRVMRYMRTHPARRPGSTSFELPMAKRLVAGDLSIQPETFSRIIRHLIDEGIIAQQGNHISVLNSQRLEQFE